MRTLWTAAIVAALAFPASPATSQDLGAAAAREKERRKAAAGKAKSYTEADLGKPGGSGNYNAPSGSGEAAAAPAAAGAAAGPGAGDAPAAAAPGGAKQKTPEEMRAEQEKAWRDRLQKANEGVATTQQRVDTLQRALNDLSQNLYGATRTQQLQQMEQAQNQLVQLRQQVADLQEEGRRNGWR